MITFYIRLPWDPVPRSIKNPIRTNASNVTGFLNILDSAYNENIKSFVYAASSSTYGDHPDLPKKEEIMESLCHHMVLQNILMSFIQTFTLKSLNIKQLA